MKQIPMMSLHKSPNQHILQLFLQFCSAHFASNGCSSSHLVPVLKVWQNLASRSTHSTPELGGLGFATIPSDSTMAMILPGWLGPFIVRGASTNLGSGLGAGLTTGTTSLGSGFAVVQVQGVGCVTTFLLGALTSTLGFVVDGPETDECAGKAVVCFQNTLIILLLFYI